MHKFATMEFIRWLFRLKKSGNLVTKEKSVSVLVMGRAAVGKTSLIRKLVDDETFVEEHVPTLYNDSEKDVNVDDYKVKFRFMELGGSQAFPTMMEVFIQQAEIYVLVYAADDKESYNTLITLRDKIVSVKKKCYSELPIIVVRNKSDLQKRISKSEKERKRTVTNWCYLNHDVSSKTGIRVNSIMDNLIEESKFIGNDQNENVSISGRYINTEKSTGQSTGRSVLYHKAPGLFSNPDNSDVKMNRRRLRETQKLGRNNSSHLASLKRSLSLTSLRRSLRRATSSRYRNRSASLRQSSRSHGGGDVTSPEPVESTPTATSGDSTPVINVSSTPPTETPVVKRTSFPVRKSAIRPGSFSMNNTSLDLDIETLDRNQACQSLFIPKSEENKTPNMFLPIINDGSNVSKSAAHLSAPSPFLSKSMSFRDRGNPKPQLERNLSFAPDQDIQDRVNRGSIRFSKASAIDTLKKDPIQSATPRKSSNGSHQMSNTVGDEKSSPKQQIPRDIEQFDPILHDDIHESYAEESRRTGSFGRNENNPISTQSRRTSMEKRSSLRKSSVEDKSALRKNSHERKTDRHDNAEEAKISEIRRASYRKRSISENDACHLSKIMESINSSISSDGVPRESVMQKRSVSLEEKRETSDLLAAGSNRRSVNSEHGNDLRRSVLCKNRTTLDSIDSFPNSNTSVVNVSGNLVAMSSPQVLRRSIPVMRTKSVSQYDITHMFTVDIPPPENKRKASSLYKSRKSTKKTSPSATEKQKRLSDQTKEKSPFKDLSFHQKEPDNGNSDSSSNSERSLLKEFDAKAALSCLHKEDILMQNKKQSMESKYLKTSEHNSTLDLDLIRSMSEQPTPTTKDLLCRKRSKSFGEIQNCTDSDINNSHFSSASSFISNHSMDSSANGKQMLRHSIKKSGLVEDFPIKQTLCKKVSVSQDDLTSYCSFKKSSFKTKKENACEKIVKKTPLRRTDSVAQDDTTSQASFQRTSFRDRKESSGYQRQSSIRNSFRGKGDSSETLSQSSFQRSSLRMKKYSSDTIPETLSQGTSVQDRENSSETISQNSFRTSSLRLKKDSSDRNSRTSFRLSSLRIKKGSYPVKEPLCKVNSLSEDDIRSKKAFPGSSKVGLHKPLSKTNSRSHEDITSRATFQKSSLRSKKESPVSNAKKWFQSLSFNKSLEVEG